MRHIADAERRARIAQRHGIAPGVRSTDILAAAHAMTVLHATDVPTVYLSLLARVDGIEVSDVDRALHSDRVLVRHLAMRRTLFAFPRDLLPAALGSASARVAVAQGRALAREVERGGLATDGAAWLERARAATLAHLADDAELSSKELRAAVPEIAGVIEYAPGRSWGGSQPVAPRVLTVLSAEGLLVRGRNEGHWRISRPLWTPMRAWLGEQPEVCDEPEGYAELVRRWLATFGPGTEADLVWWLGSTKTAARRALADVGAVQVSLDSGAVGWVLPDDVDEVPHDEEWGALLPVLDPTTMGWKERDFYLGDRERRLFDSVGNAGTTVWWNGRVVGCWVQDSDGVVHVELLEDVGTDARTVLDAEAARITAWCAGARVSSIWVSPAMKQAAGAIA